MFDKRFVKAFFKAFDKYFVKKTGFEGLFLLRTINRKNIMAARNTKKNKEKFLEIFKNNRCNISKTCIAMNMERRTYYQWIEKDEQFKKDVIDVQESLLDDAEEALNSLIGSKNIAAICFFLKTKGKSRGYIEHQHHDIYHKELPVIELSVPTAEDIEKFHAKD